MHRNHAAARFSLSLTYTERCLWDSSWHNHKRQDLDLIKQLRLLWQHILASVVSLWIFLFFNCFFSTRCWPWLPHSAPAIGFSVSQAFALGNWPEFFSSPQPLSPRLTVAGICWYLIMTESMPSDRIWPSSVAAPAELAWVGLTVTSPQSVMVLFGLNCLWCSSSGCGLLLFPAYFVGWKDRPMEELSLWNICLLDGISLPTNILQLMKRSAFSWNIDRYFPIFRCFCPACLSPPDIMPFWSST